MRWSPTWAPEVPSGYRVTGVARAPAATVWSLVATTSRWPEWSGIPHASVERQGDPPPDGVGAVRRLGMGPLGSREEIVAWDPPHHMAYTILSGFPVRGYRAEVQLAPGPGVGETTVTWSGRYDARWPLTGPLVDGALRALMGRFVRRLCRHASRVASPA